VIFPGGKPASQRRKTITRPAGGATRDPAFFFNGRLSRFAV